MEEEKQFISGFNNGYLLAKYLPELLAKIRKSVTANNEYFQGFVSGKKEYEFEQSRKQLDELKEIRKAPDRNVERDL
jgi:hypothetical protein